MPLVNDHGTCQVQVMQAKSMMHGHYLSPVHAWHAALLMESMRRTLQHEVLHVLYTIHFETSRLAF